MFLSLSLCSSCHLVTSESPPPPIPGGGLELCSSLLGCGDPALRVLTQGCTVSGKSFGGHCLSSEERTFSALCLSSLCCGTREYRVDWLLEIRLGQLFLE